MSWLAQRVAGGIPKGRCQKGQNSAFLRHSRKPLPSQIPPSQLEELEKIQVFPVGRGWGHSLLPAIKAQRRPALHLVDLVVPLAMVHRQRGDYGRPSSRFHAGWR